MLLVAVLAAAGAAVAIDGEIDVPEWANVPGVDLPFVGDDPLRCDVLALDGSSVRVQLSGAPKIIDDYVHPHVNGEPVPGIAIVDHAFVVPLPADGSAAHLSVATTAGSDDRFWCGSADLERGVTEA